VIISILNQKGGSGKTTLAVNLARYFTKCPNRRVLLVDSDPQGSARTWHEKGDGNLIRMVALDRPNILKKGVMDLKDDYDLIIIDGVPQISAMTLAAIKCSNLVLIPVQPSYYDIWATADTVDLVKEYQDSFDEKLKAYFVISRKIVNTNIGKEVAGELEKYNIPLFKHGTCQRVVYSDSTGDGLTVLETQAKEAINEIEGIAKEIEEIERDIS
jgi:chromosome partitioning protein